MQIEHSAASLLGAAFSGFESGTMPVFDGPVSWTSPIGRDRVQRTLFPALPGAMSTANGMSSILAQILSLLQQLVSAIGNGAQTFFNSAQASSTGDPHLAFDGQTETGSQQGRFDSMDDHADLLDSGSFAGGYQLGTEVTNPDANGVTYNKRASVTTDYGSTRVSLDNQGNASISRHGRSFTLAAGQSMQLSPRESVARNADGSLVITEKNQRGGSITTTLRGAGPGVDVSVSAAGVSLGGDLVRHK